MIYVLAGTGSTCVYPLLAVKLNGWKFVATEADRSSYESAVANVLRNGLGSSISGE